MTERLVSIVDVPRKQADMQVNIIHFTDYCRRKEQVLVLVKIIFDQYIHLESANTKHASEFVSVYLLVFSKTTLSIPK